MDRTDVIALDSAHVTASFPAMGNTAQVTIVSKPDRLEHLMAVAQTRLAQLEARWSRFVATSDVTRLNTSSGEWISISEDTVRLLHHMVEAHRATGGSFNPFLLPALIDAGYVTSFVSAAAGTALRHDANIGATPDDVHTILHEGQWYACLTNRATIDPGGIGKGLAADITAELLMDAGAHGVLVSVGGDLRCIGTPPDGGAWVIAVGHTENDSTVATLQLDHGGVATSTTHAKRWHLNGAVRHHVIAPHTGRPLEESPLLPRAATVLASTAAWAEAFATAALVGGLGVPSAHGLAARVESGDGTPLVNEEWKKHTS